MRSLTAHHADDQAETVLFRLLRGSGVAGLRGMELTTTRDGMTIARPLIGLKKRDLIAFANARGAPFVDDPSNADPRFARTRLRALLARLGEEGLDAEALDRLARRAGETEQALAHLTAEVEARLGADEAIDARALYAAPIAIVQRILAGASPRLADATRAGSGSRRSRRWRSPSTTLYGSVARYAANVGGALVRLTVEGPPELRPRAGEEGRAIGALRGRRGAGISTKSNMFYFGFSSPSRQRH